MQLYRVLLTGGDRLFLDRVEAFRNGQNWANAAGACGDRSGIEVVVEEYDPNLPHSFAANSTREPCLVCRQGAAMLIHSLPLVGDGMKPVGSPASLQQGEDLTARMLEPRPVSKRGGRRPSFYSNPTLF